MGRVSLTLLRNLKLFDDLDPLLLVLLGEELIGLPLPLLLLLSVLLRVGRVNDPNDENSPLSEDALDDVLLSSRKFIWEESILLDLP